MPKTVAFLALMLFVLPLALRAQTIVELPVVKDNTLYEDSGGNFSNGAGQYIFAGKTNLGEIRRALIAFDVTGALPDGAVLDSVQVHLTMNKSLGTTHFVHLHRVSQDWGEGTSDSVGQEGGGPTATEGDATWVHAIRPAVSWSIAGGDFKFANSGEIAVGSLGPAIWYNTADLLEDVNHWLSNPSENFGWLVMGDEIQSASAQRFASRENSNVSARPVLRLYHSDTATFSESRVHPESLQLTSVWPNPFSANTTVSIESNRAGSITIQVINVQGKTVHKSNEWMQTGSREFQIDGSGWTPGLYLVRITGADQIVSQTVVLTR